MISNLKSDLKKLMSIRSTYFLSGLIIGLTALFSYLGTTSRAIDTSSCQPNIIATKSKDGQTTYTDKNNCPPPKVTNVLGSDQLISNIRDDLGLSSLLIAIVVVLMMAHEYRYNTMTYTLTLSKSRSRVLASKILVASTYAALLTLLSVATVIAFTHLAVHVKELVLPSQNIVWHDAIVKALFYNLGFSLLGLGAITLLRNQIAAIVALFVLPTIDGLLSVILVHYKIEPTKYLPFNALSNVAGQPTNSYISPASVSHSAIVFLAYLGVLWLVSWLLFLRRDAQ